MNIGPYPLPLPHRGGESGIDLARTGSRRAFALEGSPNHNCGMAAKNMIRGQKINPKKLQRAREMRSSMTAAEEILWAALRGDNLGVHFRRQQIMAGFIVDFYCHQEGPVIEVDGEIHQGAEDYDAHKDAALKAIGLRVLRIQNQEVLMDLPQVLRQIAALIRAPLRALK